MIIPTNWIIKAMNASVVFYSKVTEFLFSNYCKVKFGNSLNRKEKPKLTENF